MGFAFVNGTQLSVGMDCVSSDVASTFLALLDACGLGLLLLLRGLFALGSATAVRFLLRHKGRQVDLLLVFALFLPVTIEIVKALVVIVLVVRRRALPLYIFVC